jgi:hypothetical protein
MILVPPTPSKICLSGSPKTCSPQHCRAHSKFSNFGLQIPTLGISSLVLGAFKLPRHRVAFSTANSQHPIILPGSPKLALPGNDRAHSKFSNFRLQIPTLGVSSFGQELLNYQGTELLLVLPTPSTIILQVHQKLALPSIAGLTANLVP